jgi:hypothetical protein
VVKGQFGQHTETLFENKNKNEEEEEEQQPQETNTMCFPI